MSVEKYFQIHPFFYVLDPEFLSNRTRRPPLAVLRANLGSYGLFTFRPSIFVENPQKLSFSYRKAPGPCFSSSFRVLTPF